MTEQSNFAGATAQADSQPSPAPSAQSAPSVPSGSQNAPETQSEHFLPQSKVNELVGRAKAEAYEKARREAVQTQQPTHEATVQQSNSQMGGIAQATPAELDRMIEQRLQQRDQQTQNLNIANNFLNKLYQGEGKYADFKEVMGSFNLHEFARTAPAVFHLASSVDNTAEVMYELANNPRKIADLQYTAQMNPVAAQREMRALAESIKVNEAAKNQTPASEPLDQIKPSSSGMDNGAMTVRDYKKADWLRG